MSNISLRRGDFDANMSLSGPSFDSLDDFEMMRDPADDDMITSVFLVDLKEKMGLFDVKAKISLRKLNVIKLYRNNTTDIECFMIFYSKFRCERNF